MGVPTGCVADLNVGETFHEWIDVIRVSGGANAMIKLCHFPATGSSAFRLGGFVENKNNYNYVPGWRIIIEMFTADITYEKTVNNWNHHNKQNSNLIKTSYRNVTGNKYNADLW